MFTPADVRSLVGTGAFERGEDYARRGMVVSVARNGAGETIVGHVRGSGARQYAVVVQLSGTGEGAVPRYARCSCPVVLNCKHAAATLLAYLAERVVARPAPEVPEWENAFAQLLDATGPETADAGSAGRAGDHDDLALQLELQPPKPSEAFRWDAQHQERRRAGAVPRLGMRPVVRGASGRWVRSGISWRDLGHFGYYSRALDEAQVEVLRALYGLATASGDHGYYDSPSLVFADDLPGKAFFTLLEDAVAAGIPLLRADRRQSPVPLWTARARTVVRVGSAPAGLVLTAGLLAPGGDLIDQARAVFLGRPAAGFFGWSGGSAPAAVGKETEVFLARLLTPGDDTVLDLLTRPEPLVVPAAGEQRFLTTVLPQLRSRVDDVLLDQAIRLPEAPRPALRLEVTRLPDHAARLAWSWCYVTTPRPDAHDAAAVGEPGTPGAATAAPDPVLTAALGAEPVAPLRDTEAEAPILARVAARCARLRTVLDDALPDGQGSAGRVRDHEELRGVDTARFFTEELPGLRELALTEPDFDVLVREPDEGVAVDYRFSDDVDVTVTTAPREGSRDWFDLEVVVRVGEQEVPFAEVFRALASGQTHLLLADGLHFSLDDDRFTRLRDLIAEARALQDTLGGGLRVNRYQAGLFEELEGLGVLGAQSQAWRDALGGLAAGARPSAVAPPAGLRATMRGYQHEGFEWLVFLREHGLGGVLADDMGLGKTLQTLALVQHAREHTPPGEPRSPFLVVAPTSVVGNWLAEAGQFTPDLGAVAVAETRARRRMPLAAAIEGADVVVTSYALLRLDFEEYRTIAWAGMVLDEAQFVKNHQSATYQCARRLEAPLKIALTGTPLENNLMELWSILSIVSPGLFPSPRSFAEYYAKPIERQGDADLLAQLRRRIGPFMLRRTKEAVAADLPTKQEQVTEVVLNARHRTAYDRYLQRERAKVLRLVDDLDGHRFEVFRSLSVLRQAALDVSLVDDEHAGVPSSKLAVLFEMLEDILAEGHSVLVFSQFTQFLKRVREHLDGRGTAYSYLDGRTRKRAEAIESFTSGRTSVFLISLKAGGFGLNLTAADYCILLDPWWNPAAEAQAVDRAHRIGQQRKVMVYRMVSADTIEDKVMALKAAKSRLFSSVLDGGAVGGAGLSASDVRELLA